MGTLKTVPNKPGKASAARIQALFKKLERKDKVTINVRTDDNIAADLMDFRFNQFIKSLDGYNKK